LSFIQKKPTEIQSWPPTQDDKPFDERDFGDSTQFPLKPMFNQSTLNFIKNVLNAEPVPPAWNPQYIYSTGEPEVASKPQEYHMPLIPMVCIHRDHLYVIINPFDDLLNASGHSGNTQARIS
jgi:hypothetical protein